MSPFSDQDTVVVCTPASRKDAIVVSGSEVIEADCGHRTWIAASSRELVAAGANVKTACEDCAMPMIEKEAQKRKAEGSGPLDLRYVPEAIDEIVEDFGVAIADQVQAAARDAGIRRYGKEPG